MPIKTHRSWGTCHRKQPLSLDVRIAEYLGVAPQTVRSWRHGHEPARPQNRVAGMLEVAYAVGAVRQAEEILAPIELAKAQITIPEFSLALRCEAQRFDAMEDVAEAAFTANDCRETFLTWRRAVLDAHARERRLIAAGERKYC